MIAIRTEAVKDDDVLANDAWSEDHRYVDIYNIARIKRGKAIFS